MKRSWLGFIMLLGLLLGSILSSRAMTQIHQPMEEKLLQSARCALDGDWHRAEEFCRQAQGRWEKTDRFRSCFADHTPVEEIDGDFQLLKVCCAARERMSFSGGCLRLARQVAAVGEAHEPVWWNLL